METTQPTVAPNELRDRYRLAKIEHYLREAESCFQMARYSAAAQALKRVTEIEKNHPAALSLARRIEYQMSVLKNGNGDSSASNGIALPVAPKEKRKTVLVVDQDERVLMNLSARLRKFGLKTVSALNVDEASDTISSITPDLVISEVNFANGPTGYDLFASIRSQSHTRNVPFLFLATRIDRETLIAGKRLGVDDFLFKPLDGEVVAASVMNCLSRSRRERSGA